jgi:hypothetical protein
VRYAVRIRGSGRCEVAAYGIADAEHQVEKEIRRCWADARVRVTNVHRSDGEERITEEFAVEYRVEGSLAVEAADPPRARQEAFRVARSHFAGTRYWTIAWEAAEMEAVGETEEPGAG